METPDIRQRLEAANQTGEEAVFEAGEIIPAEWIRELALDDGHPKGLRIRGGTIQGRLDFQDCILERPLWLSGCTIPDGIDLNRARARLLGFQDCPKIGGIDGDNLRVEGSFFLRRSKVKGRVFLVAAKVGENLECDGATLDGDGGNALSADRLEVSGSLFLRNGFSAKGVIRLLGAKIGGNLECDGAVLDGGNGNALEADRLEVSGDLFLRDGFFAKGSICLLGAKVGENFECNGAVLDGGEGSALDADSLKVSGGLFLGNGFSATGCLDLTHATVGGLLDQVNCWPAKGGMMLTGFTNDSIGPGAPQDAERRLDWLGRRKDLGYFDPQPYEQLAKVLKATGHDGDARRILIAKEKERLAKGKMGWFHCLMWRLYGLLSGFGYRRFRPLVWAVAIILVGAFIFDRAKTEHLMVPAKERVYVEMAKGHPFPKEYPRLNPLIYSADLFLPFVDLAQDGYWMPSSIGKWGRWVTFYMWFHIVVGWIVSALFVAGVTGLVKRD